MKTLSKQWPILFLVFASSCLADLDVKPTEIIDQTLAFQSVDDVNAGVLGVYAGLSTYTISTNTLLSDEAMWPTENNTNRGTLMYSWRQDPVNPEAIAPWQSFYQVLDRANRILDVIDNVFATPQEEQIKKQYKGELLALRAYCHFELLRLYAVDYEPASPGVPLMKTAEIGKPSRETVGKVFDQINTDLLQAKDLIPATFTNHSRITKQAVSAIQARAALWQKDWDAAITYAGEVINAMPLATIAQFPDIWQDKNNAEVVWELKREAQDAKFGDFYRDGSDKILFAPSAKLRNTMNPTQDVRFNAYMKELSPGRWAVVKYLGGQPALANLADIKLFRVAEMYLIRAEAYAAKGAAGLNPGSADLNALRAQRINGYTPEVFADVTALMNAILPERFKELAFEGHRYLDLRRKNLDITRLPEDVIQAPTAIKLTAADKAYYLPIPLRETQANENISQHPEYN
ncbi:RagB/SusD family nutrient uptake outer membrane protein [Chitinophaga sp. SYP-B3965]|uniref:RagB/SusD family nutrient uptake outer membrane protein n=1 Tax=Chitinophaga sp. SYP-B3965 TaxID=2663120 RepID=UPI0012995826|nr:RagB/SusD family nutrient uptake outer membrane protein [Chitinophaga sp. SYP-B3965]MRG46254.1 RagB/SusD family nutrient uptake outer membrane protein [Chitinophaga sp. SYP-B3965]